MYYVEYDSYLYSNSILSKKGKYQLTALIHFNFNSIPHKTLQKNYNIFCIDKGNNILVLDTKY